MSLPVHLVASLAGLAPGATVAVTGEEAHHAVAVRRLRVGEQVALTDGAGTWATGSVVGADRGALTVSLSTTTSLAAPEPSLTVVQALPKGDRGELAVEVLTEIGVAAIVPWAAARSVAVWKGERGAKAHARWVRAAREAAKQSRRAWLPSVAPLATTAAVVDLLTEADLAVVLHEDAGASLASLEVPPAGRVVVVVGPEGGLNEAEVAAFSAAGGCSVRLGDEVLRTSTAGVAACAALLARTARWA